MNNHKFKIQAVPAQELSEELPNGKDVIFQGTGSVESQITKDNHDGTSTVVSVIKPIMVEVKLSDSPIKAPIFKSTIKDRSWSQKVRDRLYILHSKVGGKAEEFEAFYAQKMEKYCDFVDQKIDEADGY